MNSRLPARLRTTSSRAVARLRTVVRPGVLLRAAVLALVVLAAAPIVDVAALLLLGLVSDSASFDSGGALLTRSLGVQAIQSGTAALAVLTAVLAVLSMSVQRAAGGRRTLRRALAHALRALPRLIVVELALVALAAAAVLLVAPLVVVALVTALVLRLRGRRPDLVRRALLLAIPLAPVAVAAGLMVTAVPAALSYPGSIRSLAGTALSVLRTRTWRVVALVVGVGTVSAALTVAGRAAGGTTLGTEAGVGEALPTETLVLVALVVALLVSAGTAFAVLLPPTDVRITGDGGRPRAVHRSGILRHPLTTASPVAVVTIVAMLIPLLPATGASAAEGAPVASSAAAVDPAAADPAAADAATVDPAASPADAPAPPAPAAPAPVPAPAAPAPAPAAPSAGAVTPHATTLDVTLQQDMMLGDSQEVAVDLTAEGTTAEPTGTIEVHRVDADPATADEEVAVHDLASSDWGFSLSTAKLGALAVDLRFTYVPDDAAFAGSEEIVAATYRPAMVMPDYRPVHEPGSDVSFGERHTFTFSITSPADGDGFRLDLVDQKGWRPISSTPFSIVDGVGTVVVDLTGELTAGHHDLYYDVPATSTHEATGSEAPSIDVVASATTTTLTLPEDDVVVGDRTTRGVAVTSVHGSKVEGGSVGYFLDGAEVRRVPVRAGDASTVWTPTTPGTHDWRVEYFEPTRSYGASRDSGSQVVAKRVPPRPTFSWSQGDSPEDSWLDGTFPAYEGLSLPTGEVTVRTTDGLEVGRGALAADGTVHLRVQAPQDALLVATYGGDATYESEPYGLPPRTSVVYDPEVTLSAPATATVDGTVVLEAGVTGLPASRIQRLEVVRQRDGAGAPDQVGVIDLDGGLSGRIEVTERTEGVWTYTAVATFDPSTNVLRTSSAPTTVTWSLPPAPQLTVVLGTGPFTAGEAVPVTVTADALPGGGHGVPVGAEVTLSSVRDGRAVTLGTVTLAAGADGTLSGTTTVTRDLGGTVDLVASVRYGTRPWTATSAPVPMVTLPPAATVEIRSTETLRVGSPATFEARFHPTAVSLTQLRGVPATITVDGRARSVWLDQPLLGTTLPFLTARVTVDVVSAADLTASITVPGDGVLYATTTATTTESVSKLGTRVTFDSPDSLVSSGAPLLVGSTVSNAATATGPAPSPTGTITVTAEPSGTSCTVPVGGPLCELPLRAIVTGPNTLVAYYSGDADHEASTERTTVTGSLRRSSITWQSSPALETVVSGSPTTFSWTVTNGTRLDPVGTVVVTLGSASCRAEVSVGRCTLTTPLPEGTLRSDEQQVALRFVPSDDSVGASASVAFTPRDCLVVTTRGATLTGEPSAACRRDGRAGFLSGSYVTARHDAVASPYAFDAWTVDGKGVSTDEEYGFAVTRSTTLAFTTRYAPACYTLELDPRRDLVKKSDPWYVSSNQYVAKGTVSALTTPNCTDPRTATPEELQQLADGRPRYAAGTVVDLKVEPVTTFTEAYLNIGTPYVVDTVTGATPVAGYTDLYRATIAGDQRVSATFRARDCAVVTLREGQGGTLAITGAERPAESRYLPPADGTCTDESGTKGYVPGTTLTISATPDDGNFFVDWRTPDSAPLPATGKDPLTLTIIGDAPRGQKSGTAGAETRTFVVPKPLGARLDLGARFAKVRCVPVTTTVKWPRNRDGTVLPLTPTSFVDVVDGAPIDDLRCGRGSTGAPTSTMNRTSDHWSQTDWFIGTAVVRVERDARTDFVGERRDSDGTWTTRNEQASVHWAVTAGGEAVADAGTTGSQLGPVIYLDFAPDSGVSVSASYVDERCRPVRVSYPQGGALNAWTDGSRVSTDSGVTCPTNTGVPGDHMWMTATMSPTTRAIVPIISRATDHGRAREEWPNGIAAADGRIYLKLSDHPTSSMVPSVPLRLEYCVPLDLTVSTQNRAGGFDVAYRGNEEATFWDLGRGGWPDLIAHDGGCPPMWARPGSTVTVGMTNVGAFAYDLVDGQETVSVPTDGTSPVVELRLRAKCASVSVGDRVSAENAPNCDHDASKYVLGSPVQLHADVPAGGRIDSWSGADKSENVTAWVVVTKDREVTADIHVPNLGERILNGLSSVAQRIVALGAVMLTGILLMEFTLVKVLGYAMMGASMGLKAVGVSGAGLDGFDRATAIVRAQTGLPSMLSNCLSAWAHGPSLTQTNLATQVGSPAGVFLANQAKDKLLYPKPDSLMTVKDKQGLEWIVNAADAFGSGSYLENASGQWSSMGSSLGSCMERSTEEQIDPIIKKY